VFNVADIGITCAAVLIIVLALRGISPDGTRDGDPAAEATEGTA
jgi:signal peptidase II